MNLKTLIWLALGICVLRGVLKNAENQPTKKILKEPPSVSCDEAVRIVNDFSDDRWECAEDTNFKKGTPLGKGSSGVSFLVKKENRPELFVAKVVYNRRDGKADGDPLPSVQKEFEILAFIKNLVSPEAKESLIEFIDAGEEGPITVWILEAATKGSLYDLIKKEPGFFADPANVDLMMLRIAIGILWLHQRLGFLHADIKPQNIVVNEKYHPKVIDFDIARPIGSPASFAGTLFYMAPEVLTFYITKTPSFTWSEKQDVYSLGVTYYAMYHQGAVPFPGPKLKDHWEQLNSKIYKMSSAVPPDVAKLISECLKDDPKNRPTMVDLYSRLYSIVKKNAKQKSEVAKIDSSTKTVNENELLPEMNSGKKIEESNQPKPELIEYSSVDKPEELQNEKLDGPKLNADDKTVEFKMPKLEKIELESGANTVEIFKKLDENNGNLPDMELSASVDTSPNYFSVSPILEEGENLDDLKKMIEAKRKKIEEKKNAIEAKKIEIREEKVKLTQRILEGSQSFQSGFSDPITGSGLQESLLHQSSAIPTLSDSDSGTPQSSKDGSGKVLFLSGFFVFTVFVLTFLLTRLVKNRKVSVVSRSVDPSCTATVALD